MKIKYEDDYVKRYRRKKGEGRLERLMDLINLKKSDTVLDIGCGNGFLADLIKDRVNSYTGIDTSSDFINEAKNRINEINCIFVNENSREYSKKNIKFNKIFMMDVSEHMDDEVFMGVLKDIDNLLKDDGLLYLHTPNKDYFMEKLKLYGLLKQTFGHIAIRSAEEYMKLIKKAGFKAKVKYLDHYLNYLNVLKMFQFVPFLKKYFQPRLFLVIKR